MQKKIEKFIVNESFERLITLVDCKIYAIKELEASESKKLLVG